MDRTERAALVLVWLVIAGLLALVVAGYFLAAVQTFTRSVAP